MPNEDKYEVFDLNRWQNLSCHSALRPEDLVAQARTRASECEPKDLGEKEFPPTPCGEKFFILKLYLFSKQYLEGYYPDPNIHLLDKNSLFYLREQVEKDKGHCLLHKLLEYVQLH